MLSTFGDILNWIAAGIVFPALLLPLAALVGSSRRQLLIWAAMVIGLVAAGALIAFLAPILRIAPTLSQLIAFSGLTTLLFVVVVAAGGPSRVVRVMAPALSEIARGVGRTVMWLILFMALTQFAVVILRYVFGINYISMQESITYMHGAVFLLAGGYALLTNDHVRVDIFYRAAPAKRKALIDLAGTYLLLFPLCLLLLWTSSSYVGNSWAVGEGSTETSGIKGVFIMKSFIPAFATLLAMAGFTIAARAGETLKAHV